MYSTSKLCALALVFAGLASPQALAKPQEAMAGAVAAPDRYGAMAAREVLKAGGNAVDAAVATGFALAVTYPEAGNLGGGGFMTLYVKGRPYFLDYRETAPAKASANMYLDTKGEVVPNLSLVGNLAAGTPGGSRIFTSVFQVLADVYDYQLALPEALAKPRFHHQLLPENTIFFEPYSPFDAGLTKALAERGYKVEGQDFNGDIEAIEIVGGKPVPAADPRARGVAIVVP